MTKITKTTKQDTLTETPYNTQNSINLTLKNLYVYTNYIGGRIILLARCNGFNYILFGNKSDNLSTMLAKVFELVRYDNVASGKDSQYQSCDSDLACQHCKQYPCSETL